jgi:hypothetical protein
MNNSEAIKGRRGMTPGSLEGNNNNNNNERSVNK